MNKLENTITQKATEFAQSKMRSLLSSHGWEHVRRVIHAAEKIAEKENGANLFIVKTAAILHDIARLEQDKNNGKICHAELGSTTAYKFLLDNGLDEARADHIAQCILTHRFRNKNKPESLEAKILFDADKLDSIGAVGIGRAFLFAGEIGAKLHNSDTDIENSKQYSEDDTAYREFTVKLRHIKETMLTKEGKAMAVERHEFMELFFSRLHDEALGSL